MGAENGVENGAVTVVGRTLCSAEPPDPSIAIEPITEERASRTLYRIELLRRIREQVLPHPELDRRLSLCQPSADLPEWWECGGHDRDLLLGASKHGVSRTDYHILNDPELAFLEAHRRFAQSKSGGAFCGAPGPGQALDPARAPSPAPKKERDRDPAYGKAEEPESQEEEEEEKEEKPEADRLDVEVKKEEENVEEEEEEEEGERGGPGGGGGAQQRRGED